MGWTIWPGTQVTLGCTKNGDAETQGRTSHGQGRGLWGGEKCRPDDQRTNRNQNKQTTQQEHAFPFSQNDDRFSSQARFLMGSHPACFALRHTSQFLPPMLGIFIHLLSKRVSHPLENLIFFTNILVTYFPLCPGWRVEKNSWYANISWGWADW